MGYTHYYQQHSVPTKELFGAFIKHAEELIGMAWDTALDVEITGDYIRINGVGIEAHEDFYLNRTDLSWNFCKTARKPYDDVVTAILILARYMFPDFSLSSDGGWGEWIEGREIFKSVIHLEASEETVLGNENHVFPSRTLS